MIRMHTLVLGAGVHIVRKLIRLFASPFALDTGMPLGLCVFGSDHLSELPL